MGFNEMADLFYAAVGTGLFLLGTNEFRKAYVKWAEENKFYDEDIKFSDLDNLENKNGKFNLPVYSASTRTPEKPQVVNFDLKEEGNPLNFDDWYLVEPQSDGKVKDITNKF